MIFYSKFKIGFQKKSTCAITSFMKKLSTIIFVFSSTLQFALAQIQENLPPSSCEAFHYTYTLPEVTIEVMLYPERYCLKINNGNEICPTNTDGKLPLESNVLTNLLPELKSHIHLVPIEQMSRIIIPSKTKKSVTLPPTVIYSSAWLIGNGPNQKRIDLRQNYLKGQPNCILREHQPCEYDMRRVMVSYFREENFQNFLRASRNSPVCLNHEDNNKTPCIYGYVCADGKFVVRASSLWNKSEVEHLYEEISKEVY